jgi:hypothetical protein
MQCRSTSFGVWPPGGRALRGVRCHEPLGKPRQCSITRVPARRASIDAILQPRTLEIVYPCGSSAPLPLKFSLTSAIAFLVFSGTGSIIAPPNRESGQENNF